MATSGVDYGRGLTNVDVHNGIRYGVISQNSILEAWCDSSEPVYPGGEPEEDDEPLGFRYDQKGIQAHGTGDFGIFITKSPFYTRAAYCSPCAPGAGDLDSPRTGGVKTYCFPQEWFEQESTPCPYPVYRVSDDTLVYVPKGGV